MAKQKAEQTPVEPQVADPAVSKAEAARAAIAAGHASPGQAVAYISEHFGIDMDKGHFSAVKSQLKKKAETSQPSKKLGRPAKRDSRAIEGYLAPPKIVPTGEGDVLDAMEALKPMIVSLGVDRVKRIVDLLG